MTNTPQTEKSWEKEKDNIQSALVRHSRFFLEINTSNIAFDEFLKVMMGDIDTCVKHTISQVEAEAERRTEERIAESARGMRLGSATTLDGAKEQVIQILHGRYHPNPAFNDGVATGYNQALEDLLASLAKTQTPSS